MRTKSNEGDLNFWTIHTFSAQCVCSCFAPEKCPHFITRTLEVFWLRNFQPQYYYTAAAAASLIFFCESVIRQGDLRLGLKTDAFSNLCEGFAIIYAFSILETRGPTKTLRRSNNHTSSHNSKSIFTLCPMMSQRFFSCALTNILATAYAKQGSP